MGAQQQGLEQNKINQAIQNYATQQQYPMMQLGMMSNMLRGLPMQSTTTQSYQAAPNTAQQLIGAAGTLGSTYQAFNPTPKKEGGVIKGLAHGGSVNSYAVGGEVKDQLSRMPTDQLEKIMQTSTSNEIRSLAAQLVAERRMAEQMAAAPERTTTNVGQGLMAANTGSTFDNMAGGGIIAFEEGSKEAIKNPEENYYYNPTTKQNELVQGRTETPMSEAIREATAGLPVQKPAQIGGLDFESNLRGIEQDRVSRGIGAPRQAEKEMVDKRLAGLDAQEYTQNKLMQAQFFAGLANNPGGILRGGLKSAEENLPKLAQLRSDQAKIRENYATIQANIAEADRLDKLGMFDKAEAIRENALKAKGENDRNAATIAGHIKGNEITAAANIRAQEIHAAGTLAAERLRGGRPDATKQEQAMLSQYAKVIKTEHPEWSPEQIQVEAYQRMQKDSRFAGGKSEAGTNAVMMRLRQTAEAKDPEIRRLTRENANLGTANDEKTTRAKNDATIARIRKDIANRYPLISEDNAVNSEDNAVNTSNPLLAK
jgi:hypothetical protein